MTNNANKKILLILLWIFLQNIACDRSENPYRIRPLAQDHVVIDRSTDPDNLYLGTPGLVKLANGRLVATLDQFGSGVKDLPGKKGVHKSTGWLQQGKIFTSDDNGKAWIFRSTFPFGHARPFTAGSILYLLGQAGDLTIMSSNDNGETWSEPKKITENQLWTGACDNVWYANDNVYLALERRYERGLKNCWRVGDIAPVLLRANVHDDLTKPESWTFASSLVFEDAIKPDSLDFFGIPFFTSLPDEAFWITPDRPMSPIGWLETNVVQFTNPNHIWNDPSGHTFHLFMRAHTGRTGYAALVKVVEQNDGSMITKLETSPSGKKIVYTPFPGGQMKFFVLFDEITKLFWMVGTQSTDSMIRPDKMLPERYNLPDNERRRLVLHFSKNMIDWCFSGIVAIGPSEKESRHYCSMAIDDDDLLIVSRSGDEKAANAHNGNLITFHRVKNFRSLVY